MKITLEMFEDCSDYDSDNVDCVLWTICIDGVEVGELNTYKEIHKQLNLLFDIEEKFELTPKK